MTTTRTGYGPAAGPVVVVGVDGSPASMNAVSWAVPEAVSRGVPLRVVHVEGRCAGGCEECERAEGVARGVSAQVVVETCCLPGDPAVVLVEQSACAALACIGATDPVASDRPLFGPVAAALAARAGCPVAIVRTGFYGVGTGVVAVVLDDSPDNDEVVRTAMEEARLRHAGVRMVDRRRQSWVRRFPDVAVQTVAAGYGRSGGPSAAPGPNLGLAVVGRRDAEKLLGTTVLSGHPIVGYPRCSVLLVRK